MGRHGARGQRRGRRRRRLGLAHVPDPRGRQEQPLPPRGPPRRDRGRRRGRHRGRRRAPPPEPRRPRRPARRRPRAAAASARATARSTGAPTRPPPCCAASAPPRATRACSTRSPATRFHLFGGHREDTLRGPPGEISPSATGRSAARPSTARSGSRTSSAPGSSSCPPTALALGGRARRARAARAAARAADAARSARSPTRSTRGVGYLHFDFYNGAMSTDQCRRLLDAYRYARERDTRVIVLMGGARLLLQRHPPERHRGRRRPGRGVVVQPAGHRRRRARHRSRPTRTSSSRRCPATRPRAACRSRSPPTT